MQVASLCMSGSYKGKINQSESTSRECCIVVCVVKYRFRYVSCFIYTFFSSRVFAPLQMEHVKMTVVCQCFQLFYVAQTLLYLSSSMHMLCIVLWQEKFMALQLKYFIDLNFTQFLIQYYNVKEKISNFAFAYLRFRHLVEGLH